MIKHIWSIICQNSITDLETRNISLINSLERVQTTIAVKSKREKILSIPINFELVSFFIRDQNDKSKLTVRILRLDPKGKELDSLIKEYKFQRESFKMRNRIRISGMPLTISGIYMFKVQMKEAGQKHFITVAELPLEVILNRKS